MTALQTRAAPAATYRGARGAAALNRSRLFTSPFLSPDERRALEDALAAPKPVGANTDLIREGQRGEGLLVVLDGWACRYTTTRDGGRQLPALLVPGDVANLDTLLLDRLDYGVRTLTQASIATIPREAALALAAAHPGIARSFIWLALVENAILSKWTLSLGRRSAKERLAHLLCELSVRLGADEGDRASFAMPLTQEHLGDVLGLTAVHINRTMRLLRADGVLHMMNRTINLPTLAALRQIGGFDPHYLHLDTPAQRPG